MRISRLAACALAAALVWPAAPASAHGSPTTPISRTAACARGGEDTGSAACQAAKKANGGGFGSFDNLRIADVGGRDREVVPDGELCSGGLDAFKGLDLPRDDYPATKVTAGGSLSVRYRATIPHAGQFRIFLTKPAYDPSKPLAWDDLGAKPLVTVTDPPLTDGAYAMKVKLPQRTGRQILYVVWETSSTPDTYYSCSDLVFPKAAVAPATTKATRAPAKAKPAATKPAATKVPEAPKTTDATNPTEAAPAPARAQTVPVADTSKVTLGHQIIIGALALGFGAVAYAVVTGILRRRRENR
ncbi:lytic polysaccharide monooxygenase auxiliary activity family 9 protein [Paractinoplanes atraurantiacus]|uniref:Chitin-binding protein n=1 Tax=Paractinoplanes atraurantiacus TaxID=1036182 RepID=A0A285HZU9_9ACTN|nr:lytic polysaccharide monooxygenase [Actinoplanes atraurantiacus]SNY41153.1 chitin-binding protein [Actinoplanes atraurantiacus]